MIIDRDLARMLIEQQFPDLVPFHLEELAGGWDNLTLLLNDTLIFRFPRAADKATFLDAEARLLHHVARALPVDVPRIMAFGEPTSAFPFPFVGYRLLPGIDACALQPSIHERIALATKLGETLAALHGISLSDALRWGARPDSLGRLDLAVRVPEALGHVERLSSLGVIRDKRGLMNVINSVAPREEADRNSLTLVHGDLYSRHLILASDARLTGIIDWGEIHLGDRAIDLSLAFSFLPAEGRTMFERAYGRLTRADTLLARFRAAWHCLHNLASAINAQDEELMIESRLELLRIVS
jgi:aminoglycoside phosphotransferase (APT) family kinase protein